MEFRRSRITPSEYVSLPEVHRSVPIVQTARGWKRVVAFLGPAYLVSVGYMDPGNWATDLEGGARFGYTLLWVLVLSNLIALLVQTLAARLGIASGRDLAQACREHYPAPIAYALWVLAEIAIAACDLAELLGTAIGLHLLFGIPTLAGVLVTGADSLLLLAIQNLGVRKFEAFILSLVFVVGVCFVIELVLAKPAAAEIAQGFIPVLPDEALYVALGIIGATVMPHNLYLHSALVQTRAYDQSLQGKREACQYNLVDTAIALNAAFFVNAAILVLAAAVFHARGIEVTELEQAHALLAPLLGTTLASTAFAVALIAAGQSSTLTGTLAGQIVMEGFIRFRMRPFLRRLVTRMIAIVPAVVVLVTMGDRGTYQLLILSQVILSMQLPFAVIPLVHFTSSREMMGELVSPVWVRVLGWIAAAIVVTLNVRLAAMTVAEWLAATDSLLLTIIVVGVTLLLAVLLAATLLLPIIRRWRQQPIRSWHEMLGRVEEQIGYAPQYRVIAAAIAHDEKDPAVVQQAVMLAQQHGGRVVLLHVVEGAVGTVYPTAYDAEARADEEYVTALCTMVRQRGIDCTGLIGHGDVPRELVRMVQSCGADVLVMGGHRHRGWKDLLFGATISPVRHALSIPVIIV
ncbi:MAG: Nramp family divalent metal transporter [Chlorobi bacterium]|nr:Nramp family divalent metal transporter [Chlorobiota bacterium]